MRAPPIAIVRAAGTATSASRRHWGNEKRGSLAGRSRPAISNTRSRRSGDATGRVTRSSATTLGDSISAHHPFQPLERAAQARRAGALTDSENPGGRLTVELEHDPQRDDFPFCPGQLRKRVLELGGEAFAEARGLHLAQFSHRVTVLATEPPRLRPEVVERSGARELAEPGSGGPAPRIEAAPAAQSALESVDREVFGEGVVGGQVHEIGENVVEVLLGDGGEALLLRIHGLYTAPLAVTSQRRGPQPRRPGRGRACRARPRASRPVAAGRPRGTAPACRRAPRLPASRPARARARSCARAGSAATPRAGVPVPASRSP